jgi:putative DNA primase/helicase
LVAYESLVLRCQPVANRQRTSFSCHKTEGCPLSPLRLKVEMSNTHITPTTPKPTIPEGDSLALQLVTIQDSGSKTKKRYLMNDAGNADRLVNAFGRDLIYCPEHGFMVWTGNHWAPDDFILVERLAEQTMRRVFVELGDLDEKDDRSRLSKFIKRSLERRGITDMCHCAKRKVRLVRLPDFDSNPHLLNVKNGVIDLRTGKLRSPLRADLSTKVIPINFNPKASCPTFTNFIKRILPDAKLLDYVQRAVGCGATGVPEKALFLLIGTMGGDNGKTTFLEICREALQGYAGEIQIETPMAKPSEAMMGNNINADLADLRGTRFVTSSEVEQGQRLNVARVKYLTGRNQIRARYLRKPFFNFAPSHKIFLDCNHKPVIKNPHDAIWNRMKCIPFDVQIPKHEIDVHLSEKLRWELPGILRWIVEGATLYLREGLPEVPKVQAATEAYRAESDALADFLSEKCRLDRKGRVGQTELWTAYSVGASGERLLTKADFEAQLLQRGITKTRIDHGKVRAWAGIVLVVSHAPGSKSAINGLAEPVKSPKKRRGGEVGFQQLVD